jgi:hypothetical protein
VAIGRGAAEGIYAEGGATGNGLGVYGGGTSGAAAVFAAQNSDSDGMTVTGTGAGLDINAPNSDLWDNAVDGTVTVRESLRLANSANGAKLSGAATATVVIRDLADTKDRVTASVDASGNRTAVTRDLT